MTKDARGSCDVEDGRRKEEMAVWPGVRIFLSQIDAHLKAKDGGQQQGFLGEMFRISEQRTSTYLKGGGR